MVVVKEVECGDNDLKELVSSYGENLGILELIILVEGF